MAEPDIRIVGAEKLQRVARKLKETGDKELRKELYSGIQRAAKPVKAAMQAAARAQLPKAGGLNNFVADGKFSVSTKAGSNPGVTIKAKKGGGADRGRIRHPVFGNKAVQVTQQVDSGWFTQTGKDAAPVVRAELLKVIDDVARKIK